MPRIFLLTILIFAVPPVLGEAPELAGKNELSLHGGFDLQGANGDNIDFQIGYGWFLRDDLLVVGEYRWVLAEDIAPGGNDYRSQQGSLVAEKFFLGDSQLVPYVGLEIGFRNTKFTDANESGLVFGGRVGARYFISESVSVDGSLSFLTADKEVFIVDFEADDQYFYPGFGINAVF